MKLVVVGAGVAGTAAALAGRDLGADVLVVRGAAGASSWVSGTWDIATDSEHAHDALAPRLTVEDRIRARVRTAPTHPYARFAGDPVEAIARAHARVLSAVGIYRPLDLSGPGVLVATDLGRFRRVATAQRALLDLGAEAAGLVAVASLRGHRAVDGGFVARSLGEAVDGAGDDFRFIDVAVEYFRRRSDALLHGHEIAALADADDTRVRIAETLCRALPHDDPRGWLMPPVLGLEDDGAADAVSRMVGVPVGEVAQPLAGPQGLRLVRRLADAVRASGAELVDARVRAVRLGKKRSIELTSGGELEADAIVLATGGAVSGGLVARGGTLVEPLAALATTASDSPSPALAYGGSPFRRGPLHAAGVAYDARFHALDPEGRVVDDALFVAGSLLDGADPADGTGLGVAATTGWLAGVSALRG